MTKIKCATRKNTSEINAKESLKKSGAFIHSRLFIFALFKWVQGMSAVSLHFIVQRRQWVGRNQREREKWGGRGDREVREFERKKKMAISPEEHPQKAFGWAARDSSGILSPFRFSRRFVFIFAILVFSFIWLCCDVEMSHSSYFFVIYITFFFNIQGQGWSKFQTNPAEW